MSYSCVRTYVIIEILRGLRIASLRRLDVIIVICNKKLSNENQWEKTKTIVGLHFNSSVMDIHSI